MNGKTTQSFQLYLYHYSASHQRGFFSYGPVTVGGVRSNKVTRTISARKARKKCFRAFRDQHQGSGRSESTPTSPSLSVKGTVIFSLRLRCRKVRLTNREALVYTVKLYTTYDAIKFIGAGAAPKFDGFVVRESKAISSQLNYEDLQRQDLRDCSRSAIYHFPQMTGSLKVTGNTYKYVAADQREYYHDPFFGSMSAGTPLRSNVTPNDLSVDVRPLPPSSENRLTSLEVSESSRSLQASSPRNSKRPIRLPR